MTPFREKPLDKKEQALLKEIKLDFDHYLKSLSPKHCKITRNEWTDYRKNKSTDYQYIRYIQSSAIFEFICPAKTSNPRFQWKLDRLVPKKDIPAIENITLLFDDRNRIAPAQKEWPICARRNRGQARIEYIIEKGVVLNYKFLQKKQSCLLMLQ